MFLACVTSMQGSNKRFLAQLSKNGVMRSTISVTLKLDVASFTKVRNLHLLIKSMSNMKRFQIKLEI